MATRAIVDLKGALIKTYTVKSGTTIVAGNRVKFGTSDTEVDVAGAAEDNSWGTALDGAVGDGTAAKRVEVALDGHAIVAMTVGTGASTRGLRQVLVSDGITDAKATGVNTAQAVVGVAMQSGIAGDSIGVLLGASPRIPTTS